MSRHLSETAQPHGKTSGCVPLAEHLALFMALLKIQVKYPHYLGEDTAANKTELTDMMYSSIFSTRPLPLSGLLILLAVGICLYSLLRLFTAHLTSQFPHLPAPNQGPVWCRLIHEPRVSEIEKWVDELPHKGLIRYYGIFNRERIFVASPEAARDLLTTNAYRFIKPQLQWTLANNISGEGLLIQEGKVHKEARKRFNPAFSPTMMKTWFPSLWRSTVEAL